MERPNGGGDRGCCAALDRQKWGKGSRNRAALGSGREEAPTAAGPRKKVGHGQRPFLPPFGHPICNREAFEPSTGTSAAPIDGQSNPRAQRPLAGALPPATAMLPPGAHFLPSICTPSLHPLQPVCLSPCTTVGPAAIVQVACQHLQQQGTWRQLEWREPHRCPRQRQTAAAALAAKCPSTLG